VRSLTVALDGSMVVAANNHGTCYVWRMMRGTSLTTHFEPLHKLRAHQVRLPVPAFFAPPSTFKQHSDCSQHPFLRMGLDICFGL
jgi:hypothetical protein